MIYTYVFAPGPECSSDSAVIVAALGDRYYKRSPSGVLLRTCRLINAEAANMFSRAMGNFTLVIDLSSARNRGNPAVGNTHPFPGLVVPRLNNDQMSQLKRFNVIANTGRRQKELFQFYEAPLPCGILYWAREDVPEWYRSGSLVERHVARSLVPGARKQRMLKKKQFDEIIRGWVAQERLARLRKESYRESDSLREMYGL